MSPASMDPLILLESIDSTNAEARRRWAAGPLANGTTLLALSQTAGRGRQGHAWHAQPGRHLAMTIVLRPTAFAVASLPTLNMKISLGLAKAIKVLAPNLDVRIKWPNDIFIRDRKVAGILIENILAGPSVSCAMIGIGLNVNETDFPDDLPFAISLRQMTGETYDLLTVAEVVRDHVLREVEEQDIAWQNAYRSMLYGLDQRHIFAGAKGIFSGIIREVDEKGRLVLEDEHGARDAHFANEIQWQR